MSNKKNLAMRMVPVLMALALTGGLQAAEVASGIKLAAIQQLVRNNGAEVASLDPHQTSDSHGGNVMAELLEGLVNFGPNGTIVPGVAARWHTADQQHWTFYLRPTAKWSNGDPVTAHDFVYSWRRLANPKTASPYACYLQLLKLENEAAVTSGTQPLEALGIKALDRHTLQIALSQPVSYFIKMLAHQSLYPVHQATIERYGDHWTSPKHYVGNGAYRLKEWVVNEKIVLIRSQTYWDNDKTVIKQIQYLPINSEVTDVARYRAGSLDITYKITVRNLLQEVQRTHLQALHSIPTTVVYYYEFNTRIPPFNDVRIRQALALTLDREQIVNQILGQGEKPAYTLNPTFIYNSEVALPAWAHWSSTKRQQEAKKLLQAAGYSQQKPLKFTLLYNASEMNTALALAASHMWQQQLGAQVTLENQEWKSYLDTRQRGHYQLSRMTWIADYHEPSAILSILLSGSGSSSGGYQSPAFDALMAQALAAADEPVRERCYQQAEAQLAVDMPLLPVFHTVDSRLVKPYIRGYREQSANPYIYTKNLYIVQH